MGYPDEFLIQTACSFYVGTWKGNRHVKIECRNYEKLGDHTAKVWAIVGELAVYSKENAWEYEPSPSERTPEFFERCRYTLTEAIKVIGWDKDP